MGNSVSRIEKQYGNYEKNFIRLDEDFQRIKGQLAARLRSRASLSMWTSLLIAAAVAVAAGLIYQMQQQPAGALTLQQHFQRTAAAVAVPVVAVLLHWLMGLWSDMQQRRDTRRLQRLEASQKAMLKELKEMVNYDKVKSLIDRFDPEAAAAQAALAQAAAMRKTGGRGGSARQQQQQVGFQQQQQQQQGQGQVPAFLVKGSGQVAGAAALAVAGAGKALMPLVDRLATTLISDNPMLLEDLRRAQQQLQDAQERTVGAMQESLGLKHENLELKLKLVELEQQLKLEPSFDTELLQEQRVTLYQQTQQVAWQVELQQQYLGQPPVQQQQLQQQLQQQQQPQLTQGGEWARSSSSDGGGERAGTGASTDIVGTPQ